MIRTEDRHYCQLAVSPETLAAEMRFRGFTVTSLYETVLPKAKRKRVPLCRATIGHLRSGHRNTVPVEVASAIEEALGARPGSFFRTRLSNVAREVAKS